MKKMWYWMWYKFDWGHCIVGAIAALIVAIYPCYWTAIGTACTCFLFFGYQVWEAIKVGDRGWTEIKGFLTGWIFVGLLSAIVYRILHIFDVFKKK